MEDSGSEPAPTRSMKIHYVIILAVLLAIAVSFVVVRGVMSSVDNKSNPVQQHTNSTSPGTTQDTGAPTNNTGTPSDRTNPSPSGSDANTLLNPDQ